MQSLDFLKIAFTKKTKSAVKIMKIYGNFANGNKKKKF